MRRRTSGARGRRKPGVETNVMMRTLGTPELIVTLLVYVLPTMIALLKHQPDWLKIMLVSILLGWTFVGYIVALVWALRARRPATNSEVFSHRHWRPRSSDRAAAQRNEGGSTVESKHVWGILFALVLAFGLGSLIYVRTLGKQCQDFSGCRQGFGHITTRHNPQTLPGRRKLGRFAAFRNRQ
jgi:hypothetical protein